MNTISTTDTPLDVPTGDTTRSTTLPPPSPQTYENARTYSDAQAKPLGAFGRLEELAAWISACQEQLPPAPLDDVRVVVFAGDHGVAAHGVSAYPSSVTTAIATGVAQGTAGVNALASAHGIHVRVVDISCLDDIDIPLPAHASPVVKIRRGSEPFHLRDALTLDETRDALQLGARIATEEIADGAQLLIAGDVGIGNTTAATALIAATYDLPVPAATGRGTGVDDEGLRRKTEVIETAIARIGARRHDPLHRLAALGSADLAAATGFMMSSARQGVPLLVDGVISAAEAVMAESLQPGTRAWMRAGHLSPEPGCGQALSRLGLTPIVDLGMRLGEGSGAVCAVPIVRTAVAGIRELALLSELTDVDHPDNVTDRTPQP
ncbi:nicotinate-nucleotide-dimethylbenzimidazole phosphoribosyltransferase [Austwickia chelonae]|uniref:Nicotinate-nucleotide--dimethylbenzimidazole phosphoribosyltransferase n=1 Tax=Austwickia chelonae NBRC 105200 TaxID=1184607 RepID=K6VNC2_9MICO|nr:nicotinate-nucleotide--dimethylbenzimidazole phosphoribosyltransferase [Austwickia chelonae]GAB76880.1 nicotinate-nucleotide--dimethylbenzimidazole phosphoribosyltransferase [Austwickia chelonae NBRC 105200]SEW31911.1 nicotinate-nucleotide-dimethylbenzimidazole phosphoribosyltransferase [Austwickia chelonae]